MSPARRGTGSGWGPGHAVYLLGKFQEEGLIQETEVDGPEADLPPHRGREGPFFQEELDRLRACLNDAEEEI